MTHPYRALEGVSYVLPDGRTLFADINETFDQRATGLVGRNGAGKTILTRMLAGQVQPATGRCLAVGSVHYLAQHVSHPRDATVATLTGVQHVLDALCRIESGSSAAEDFDAVGERWDVRHELRQALDRRGLEHLDDDTPASVLSGGEAMRVALIGAMLSDADFLILDEPSNHLDGVHRKALIEQLRDWKRGLLVVSHDRALLDTMERIVELSPLGLRSYGGNYTFYAASKAHERQQAAQLLEQRKLERLREERAMREQRQRLEQRKSRGKRHGKEANQAKVLLGRQKERGEGSAGKLLQQHALTQRHLAEHVRAAAQRVEADVPISLHASSVAQVPTRRVAELCDVVLPFIPEATRSIGLTLSGQQRLGIVGANGCGKSTLLKVLAGQLEPLAGTRCVNASHVYLDQRPAHLDPQRTVLEQLQASNPLMSEADRRMRLAHLGLTTQQIGLPSGSLSGGERLKAALARVLYADPPPQLLLLDEPSNHLDLPSIHALESMLQGYRGALVVVSHDDAFMDRLGLTHRLSAGGDGWSMAPW